MAVCHWFSLSPKTKEAILRKLVVGENQRLSGPLEVTTELPLPKTPPSGTFIIAFIIIIIIIITEHTKRKVHSDDLEVISNGRRRKT